MPGLLVHLRQGILKQGVNNLGVALCISCLGFVDLMPMAQTVLSGSKVRPRDATNAITSYGAGGGGIESTVPNGC